MLAAPEIGVGELSEVKSIGTDSGNNLQSRHDSSGVARGVTANGTPDPRVVEMRTAIVDYPTRDAGKVDSGTD